MLSGTMLLGFNGVEAFSFVILCVAIFLVFLSCQSVGKVFFVATMVVPVILLTAPETTQFMTMDEVGISARIFDPANRAADQIMLGVSGVGLLIALPITKLLEWFSFDVGTIRMLLKGAWWLVGNCIVFVLSIITARALEPGKTLKLMHVVLIFSAIALLPTTQLGLKTLNYDIISAGLGAMAVLAILRGISEKSEASLSLAFFASFLAAQEKLTAGPILISSIAAIAMAKTYCIVGWQQRWRAASGIAARLIFFAILMGVTLRAFYWVWGPQSLPDRFWLTSLDPLSSWLWVPLKLFLPIEVILDHRLLITAVSTGVMVLGIGTLAALLPNLVGRFQKVRSTGWRAYFASLLLIVIYGLGITGALTVQGYWAPFHPISSSNTALVQALNFVSLHTGAASASSHYVQLLLYAMAVMVVAVPTALWLFAAIGLGACILRPYPDADRICGIVIALLMLSLLTPVAAALTGIPFAHRYFNLSLILLASGLVLSGLCLLRLIPGTMATFSVTACLILALLVETAPFRPLFAAFRPFWLSYGDARMAEPGRLNASWMGWGEEVMQAGKLLEHKCLSADPSMEGMKCQDLTLHVMSSGLWLPGPREMRVVPLDPSEKPLRRSDYYVVSRLYLIQNFFPIPDIEPNYRISYRGYDLAWVYRGDRLAAAGYQFKPPKT